MFIFFRYCGTNNNEAIYKHIDDDILALNLTFAFNETYSCDYFNASLTISGEVEKTFG